ncbi:S-norcoclaurine synthase 1 [Heracleum sosnowskyi]|uniref:S-norcoclaurine synthase 1 n=1 Tax=Heracleum sosnowskyi TaxID=360622 RepID=A0AAD8I6Z9_9APIA|nr:S-norcoclaurine synthase 1 [Heracleum sosnowskyi]
MASPKVVSTNNLGSSLPVKNVQLLASQNLKDIPPRYVRPEFESEEILDDDSIQIPVIDMSKLVIGQLGYDDELQNLHLACKHWGFFQLVNHGGTEIIEKMKVVTEQFFNLPLEEKKEWAQPPDDIEGYGQVFVFSEDQKLDWADMFFLYLLPVSLRKMRLWPAKPPSFRSTLDEYSREMHKISMSLFRSIEINLGVEPGNLSRLFDKDCKQGIRLNYYPPCNHANKVIGLTPHSDAVGLTLLIQVNDVQGLQMKKNDKWLPIKPAPGAIIVNIGDMLEIMSNGEYSSIEHRAVVNYENERISVATFHMPDLATTLCPLPELVNDNHPKFINMSIEEFLRLNLQNTLDGKRLLNEMKIIY